MKLNAKLIALSASLIFSCLAARGASEASLADFPRLGGDTSDSERISRAASSVPFGVLKIPAGEYELDKTVRITNAASLKMHKAAKFRAVKEMDYMLFYDGKVACTTKHRDGAFDHSMFIEGGDFNAAGLANCIKLGNYFHFTLRDTVFRNPKRFGLTVGDESKKMGGYELIATNLYFRNSMSGLAGNTGMCIYNGDNHFTDCVIVDYTIGIDVRRGGSNRFTRCHIWGGPLPSAKKGELREMLKDSICFKLSGGESLLRDCYADTALTGFKIEANTRLLGCSFYNNYRFKMDNPTVIDHVKGILLVSDCYFSKTSPNSLLYKGDPEKNKLIWHDNILINFKDSEIGLPQKFL